MISLQYFHEYALCSIVLSGTALMVILYLLVEQARDFFFPAQSAPQIQPARALVPVSRSPYVIAPTRRTRHRNGSSAQGRIEDELLWMRRLQRELKFRSVSNMKLVRGAV